MAPFVTLAICGTCGKSMNKDPIGDLWECSNVDCSQYAQLLSEAEIEDEEDDEEEEEDDDD